MKRGCVIGYDINEKGCQISYYDDSMEEPDTMMASSNNYLIPLVLGYFKDRWVFGKEAKRLLALSRADNRTMICDECGTKEALDAVGLTEGSSVRKSILACVGRGSTPQERVRAKVQATGNKWAVENFNATHN